MKNLNSMSLGVIVSIALVFQACKKEDAAEVRPSEKIEQEQQIPVVTYEKAIPVPGQYIVVLKEEVFPANKNNLNFEQGNKLVHDMASDIFNKIGVLDRTISHTYARSVNGFVTLLNTEELLNIQKDHRVEYVEQDQFIALKNPGRGKPGGGSTTPPAQSTPWGITNVGGSGNGATSGKKVWVIDSGIDMDHPDLNVDALNSQSFLSGKQSTNPDDQFGHGTHVAGTIGALDNSIGVIGVAAGVPLVSVRVLDRRGSGTVSGVVAGVNYVASYASENDIANMSLGGGISTTLDNAVKSASSNGIDFVIAAGNDSRHASNSSPARANGSRIYTISAMDVNGIWASFSNYGNPPVDFCAPGVSVLSTYKGNSYATMSGTSMAAPHVAGILVLGSVYASGNVIGDPDGLADGIAHR